MNNIANDETKITSQIQQKTSIGSLLASSSSSSSSEETKWIYDFITATTTITGNQLN